MSPYHGTTCGYNVYFIVGFIQVIFQSVSGSALQEYCQFDTFSAQCKGDEIIVMDTALYGRMNLGKCVTSDLGYVGCVRDVQYLADRKCSGRRECEIDIPDEDFDNTKPCLTELKFYFEANYTCMKVSTVTERECSVCNYGVTLKRPTGLIASYMTEETACGSPDCPWIVELEKGQRINITLLDFGLDRPESESSSLDDSVLGCRVYATIKEETDTERRAVTICGGNTREKHVYTSRTNRVEIRIVGQTGSDKRKFVLKYNAFGCPSPPIPRGGWARRTGHKARVGCNITGENWELKCVDEKWKGFFKNCTEGSISGGGGSGGGTVIPSGLSIVVILAVAFTIGCCIFVVGLFVIKSSRKRSIPRHSMDPDYAKAFYEQQQIRGENNTTIGKQYHQPVGRDRNDYAHIWEMPLPHSPSNRTDGVNSDLESNRTISPYGYGYRTDIPPNYQMPPGATFTSCPPGKREYQEVGEDPRYFQLDPDLPNPPADHQM